QSFQGSNHLGVMLDQRLPPGSGVADALHGEGILGEALNGPIDGRAREPSNPGDQGNTASSQSLAVEAGDGGLLSLIEVRKQQGIFPLKFFGWAHSGIIPTPLGFVTANVLRTLSEGLNVHGIDASPSFVEAFQHNLPGVPVACESVDESLFFNRMFDGVVAWGLIFLLQPHAQRRLISRIADILVPGGRFLFTACAGVEPLVWNDAM